MIGRLDRSLAMRAVCCLLILAGLTVAGCGPDDTDDSSTTTTTADATTTTTSTTTPGAQDGLGESVGVSDEVTITVLDQK